MTKRLSSWLVDVVAPLLLIVAVVVIGLGTGYPTWWISLQAIAVIVGTAYLAIAWRVWPKVVPTISDGAARPGALAASSVDGDDANMLRWRWRSVWLSISMATVVIAALAGAIAAPLCGTASRDAQVDRNRRDLPGIADHLVTTVLSYRAGHRGEDRSAAGRFVTGDFAQTFFAPPADLSDTTTVQWQPARTALDEVGSSTATVTVAANVIETTAGAPPKTSGKVVVLQLVRNDSRWQVADVRSIL